jgi:hypothetical protein
MRKLDVGQKVRRRGESNTGILTVTKVRTCLDNNQRFAGYAYFCEWSPGNGHEFPDDGIEPVDASGKVID